jgi:hypothetical protein
VVSLLVTFAAEIQAYEFVFAAGVKKAVGESWVSADLSGEDLRAVEWLEGGGSGGGANEFAFFGENEELIASEGESGCAESVLLPANFASLEFDATKAGGRFEAGIGPAMDAEEKAVEMNARGIVVGEYIVAGPDFFGAVWGDFQEDSAEAVTGREKNRVVDNEWSGGSDGGADRRTKWILKEDLSVRGIEGNEVGKSQNEKVTTAIDSGGDRRRVTGLIIGSFPKDFAGQFVKGDDSRAVASAYIQDERVALDERRASDTKEAFRSVKLFLRVECPSLLSGGEIEAG